MLKMINIIKTSLFLTYKTLFGGNKKIPIMTIFMMMLVYINLIFTPSILEGLVNRINENLRNGQTADIVIKSNNTNGIFDDVETMYREIENIKGVSAVTSRTQIGAEIHFNNYKTTYGITVIDPEREQKVFSIQDHMIEGSFLEPGDENKIVLGVQVAGNDKSDLELYSSSLKNVHANDKVKIKFSNGLEKEYTVKGIFDMNFVQIDTFSFITNKDYAQINPITQNTAGQIYVLVKDNFIVDEVAEDIKNSIDEVTVLTWEEIAGSVKSMTQSFDIIIAILRVIALFVAGITIFIITYVDLVNKKKQIGIQRAIGITSSTILLTYVLQAVILSIIGTIFSAILFIYIIVPFEHKHPFSFPFGKAYMVININQMLHFLIILLIVGIIAAIIPTMATLRQKILDAIWS